MALALLERVATLIKANINDLLDKAEDPEKLLKQVILDMQNQQLQVKTQVAIAIADQHLLMKRQEEHKENADKWMKKAELAVSKKEDDLARAAIERSMSYRKLAESFTQQVEDQRVQVENLKAALQKLTRKLDEAQAKADLLIAQHRRARVMSRAGDARLSGAEGSEDAAFDLARAKVQISDAVGQAKAGLVDNLEQRFASLEQQDEIEKVLSELKRK